VAATSPMMHAEAVRRLHVLMHPAPRPRGVWAGLLATVRHQHQTFKETRRGIERRAARLFTLRES
jgi:hypothetical protein